MALLYVQALEPCNAEVVHRDSLHVPITVGAGVREAQKQDSKVGVGACGATARTVIGGLWLYAD